MWAKIELKKSESEVLYLPSSLAVDSEKVTTIIFGKKTVNIEIEYSDEFVLENVNSFETPGIIGLSEKLKDALLIPTELIYRVKISDCSIFIGPVIGFLLGIHAHRYNPRHMEKYSDRLGIYNKVGGLIYAFSPKSINWDNNTAYGLFYNIVTSAWEYGCFPIPDVIYRRDFHSEPELIEKLVTVTESKLFNSRRLSKFELYDLFSTHKEFLKYLPATELSFDFNQIKKFMDSHPKSILKPIDLSRGRGICVIEKTGAVYKITDYRYKYPIRSFFHDSSSLENYFSINQGFFNKYLIQQYLQLAKIGSSLFDIRVVMQKHENKTWGCTGIECRVSNSNFHLTNISRGGYALTLKEALQQSFKKDYETLPKQIDELCQMFCSHMDTIDGHFAEFGIDVAVDINKRVWFIEANVFPSFKGFKIIDAKTYLSIRYRPLIYALSLTRFKENELKP